jgi:hypothetical protein
MGAKIYNSDATAAIVSQARIQTSSDRPPSELAEKAIPVIDMTPRFHKVVDNSFVVVRTVTGTGAATTLPATGRTFYLTAVSLSNMSDVTADNTEIGVSCSIGGVYKNILTIQKLSLTAFNQTVSKIFVPPIKIDKGSDLRLSSTFTVGVSRSGAEFQGYFVDD